MKIYLAGPWVHKDTMPEVAAELEGRGHAITQRWWEIEAELETGASEEFKTACAFGDANGVRQADLLIVYNSEKSEGKAVEQGIAIAQNKPIIIVGTRGQFANIFHYLPNYFWVKDTHEMLLIVDAITWLTSYRKEVADASRSKEAVL